MQLLKFRAMERKSLSKIVDPFSKKHSNLINKFGT
jgi:hypothetical protein